MMWEGTSQKLNIQLKCGSFELLNLTIKSKISSKEYNDAVDKKLKKTILIAASIVYYHLKSQFKTSKEI